MNVFDLWSFILLLLIAILVYKLLRSILFFIYLYQIKEYRLDRFFIHFKTYSGLRDFLDNFNLLKWKRFYFPKLTVKVIISLILIFFFQYNFIFLILSLIFSFFLPFPGAILLAFLFAIIVTIYLVPLFVVFTFFVTDFFSIPLKELVFNLAASKINKINDLTVIGITGSYGKTSTKDLIKYILKEKYSVLATPKNCNTKLGIAIFILKYLRQEHNIFIVEMGAYKLNEIKEICDIVKPKIGIITGINEQHLALFGSLQNTIKAKYELIRSLPKEGMAFFNNNNKYCRSMFKRRKIEKYFYGKKRLKIKLSDYHSLYQENIQAALMIGKSLGLSQSYLTGKINKINKLPLRLKLLKKTRGVRIIDDTYSSNPNGFLSILDFASNLNARKKVLITPGIIELGKSANKIHETLGKKSAMLCDYIFLTKKDFLKPFNIGVNKAHNNICIDAEENLDELMEKLKNFKKMGYLIILEGRVPVKIKKFLLNN